MLPMPLCTQCSGSLTVLRQTFSATLLFVKVNIFCYSTSTDFIKFYLCVYIFLGSCPEPECADDNIETLQNLQNREGRDRDLSSETEEGTLMASTSVFVLEPGASPCKYLKNILIHLIKVFESI